MLCEMYTDKHNCYTFEQYKNNESLVNLQHHEGSNNTFYVTEMPAQATRPSVTYYIYTLLIILLPSFQALNMMTVGVLHQCWTNDALTIEFSQ